MPSSGLEGKVDLLIEWYKADKAETKALLEKHDNKIEKLDERVDTLENSRSKFLGIAAAVLFLVNIAIQAIMGHFVG